MLLFQFIVNFKDDKDFKKLLLLWNSCHGLGKYILWNLGDKVKLFTLGELYVILQH